MFDCVLPTDRPARAPRSPRGAGLASATPGSRVIRDPSRTAAGARPARVLEGLVRHPSTSRSLGLRLLTLHNLWFTLRLTAGTGRDLRGAFDAYRADAFAALAAGPEEETWQP